MSPLHLPRLPVLLAWLALVLGTSWWTYALLLQSGRARWRRMALPPEPAGVGAYRAAHVAVAPPGEPPALVRVASFLALVHGRMVLFGLFLVALAVVDPTPGSVQFAASSVLVGYVAWGYYVGVVGLMVTAALLLRAASGLLLRDWSFAFERARTASVAALVLHAGVFGRALWGRASSPLLPSGFHESIDSTLGFSSASVVCAGVMLVATLRYRGFLTAPPFPEMVPEARAQALPR